MDDLVWIRGLIRTPLPNGFPLSINHVFAKLRMETLFGCVISRASPPCHPIVVALAMNLLGLKSINACARAGKTVESFARRYTERLNILIRLDVGPEEFSLFRGGMDRCFVLACQTSTILLTPNREDIDRSTRPLSLIQMDV